MSESGNFILIYVFLELIFYVAFFYRRYVICSLIEMRDDELHDFFLYPSSFAVLKTGNCALKS